MPAREFNSRSSAESASKAKPSAKNCRGALDRCRVAASGASRDVFHRLHPDEHSLRVPDQPRYEILSRAGLGGIGILFKARDRETNEVVALKVLKAEIADQPELIEAFKNELRLARKITHKNVCRIYDFSRADGISFISMEFVEGESLRRVLNRFNALSTRTALKVASQICDGLREAHAQGIVHRDLKPENLMIDGSGNVKLMDFGLAHLVAEGSTDAVGTPSYMAPEQAQGAAVDQRCDIYALGLVLFEMFTGRVPSPGRLRWSLLSSTFKMRHRIRAKSNERFQNTFRKQFCAASKKILKNALLGGRTAVRHHR